MFNLKIKRLNCLEIRRKIAERVNRLGVGKWELEDGCWELI
jgi:hypothetical protein